MCYPPSTDISGQGTAAEPAPEGSRGNGQGGMGVVRRAAPLVLQKQEQRQAACKVQAAIHWRPAAGRAWAMLKD
jgi:hypothetical protein